MFSTSLCYLEKEGSWLMLHRIKKKDDLNEGKWIGVGGKVEEGESPEDCVVREVSEETGYQLHTWCYRGIITFVSDQWESEHMHLFTSSDFSGEPHGCDEGVAEWIPIHRIPELRLWEGDRIFLRLLRTAEPFFSLKLVYRGDTLVQAVLNGKPVPLREYGEKDERESGKESHLEKIQDR